MNKITILIIFSSEKSGCPKWGIAVELFDLQLHKEQEWMWFSSGALNSCQNYRYFLFQGGGMVINLLGVLHFTQRDASKYKKRKRDMVLWWGSKQIKIFNTFLYPGAQNIMTYTWCVIIYYEQQFIGCNGFHDTRSFSVQWRWGWPKETRVMF